MPDFQTILTTTLGKCRLPRKYAEKVAAELSDHYLQLVEQGERNGLSTEDAQKLARETIGEPDQLAYSIGSSYRKRSIRLRLDISSPLATLRFIGGFTVGLAFFGLYGTWGLAQHVLSGKARISPEAPYFYEAYSVMLLISVSILLLLVWSGVQILLRRQSVLQLFVVTCLLMIAYCFGTGAAWLDPTLGRSIASASGVSSGGLAFFEFTLFPFWAPFAVAWAMRKLSVEKAHAA